MNVIVLNEIKQNRKIGFYKSYQNEVQARSLCCIELFSITHHNWVNSISQPLAKPFNMI